MSSKLKNVVVVCGGQSAEHEISLLSAKNVIAAIDKTKFRVNVVGISKLGTWHELDTQSPFTNTENAKTISFIQSENEVYLPSSFSDRFFYNYNGKKVFPQTDVILPVLHGPNGEDGTIQGLFKLAQIPTVGCGVLSSAMCMDKDITKKILAAESIPVCKHLLARKDNDNNPSFARATTELGETLFIKPANMGSSVGVSKVTSESEYQLALATAFKYDSKVLIEEAVEARELEVALLGHQKPKASVVGEVAPKEGFYSFDAKYLESDAASLIVPAKIPEQLTQEIQTLACKAFKALECSGLARCDFFYTKDKKLLINEINTFPGFTDISQYPMLWKESGIDCTSLLTELIHLALN